MMMDEHGMYIMKHGKKIYTSNETFKFSIDGKQLYDYNKESGILKISASPESLEHLVEAIGGISEEGKKVVLPLPFGEPMTFIGVKKLESIPSNDNTYLMSIEESKPEYEIQKLKTEKKNPLKTLYNNFRKIID